MLEGESTSVAAKMHMKATREQIESSGLGRGIYDCVCCGAEYAVADHVGSIELGPTGHPLILAGMLSTCPACAVAHGLQPLKVSPKDDDDGWD